MKTLSLKELCECVGVSRRVIQCYEAAGLMHSTSKNKYGHLIYDADMKERAEMIRFMQEAGFTLTEIKTLIDEPSDTIKMAFAKRLPMLEKEEEKLRNIIIKVRAYINN